jgi:pimeloyl-ACP methyl ester carboxylesterase
VGRRTIAQLICGAALAAVLLGGQLVAGAATSAQAATVADRTCDDGLPGRAVCGSLSVPENRADPASRLIELDYAVIPASSGATGTPVVALSGGPGSASDAASIALADDTRIGGVRDVIVLAQRGGAGSSEPIDCPAVTSAYIDTFTSDDSPAGEMTDVAARLQECTTAFAEEGGNVSSYTRSDTVSDLIDLRNALQIPVWTVYAEGWATKVAQLAASRDAGGIDALVLDRFSPVDRDVKADAYQALSDTLTALSARSDGEFPDLNADLAAAAALFSDEPVNGILTNPVTDRQRYYSLTGSDVVTVVQQALADPESAAAVPLLLSRLAEGDTGAIDPFLPIALERLSTDNRALTILEQCRDEQPFWSADPVEPAAEGAEDTEPTPLPVITWLTSADAVCASAGLAPSAGEDRTSVRIAQPTLIIAGDSDPFVPRGAADAGAANFAAQLLPISGNGASSSTEDPCALDQIAAWLAAPGSAVAAGCADRAEELPIIPADAVHDTARFDSVSRAVESRNWFELTVPLIFAGFTALWLIGWIIAVIVQAVRRERFGLVLVSGIAPVTGAIFLVSLWIVVSTARVVYPGITLVGLPTIAPWLGLALLGVGFFGIIPVWRLGGRATAALAAAATIVWLAAIVWFVWVAVL